MSRLTQQLGICLLLCFVGAACAAPNTPTPPSKKAALCDYVNWVMQERNRDIVEARKKGTGMALSLEPVFEWKVGTTSVSRLAEEQKRMLLGETTEDSSALLLGASPGNTLLLGTSDTPGKDLPLKFDWRQHEGGDWTTPIRDQGLCQSCVAHAAVAVMESLLEIAAGDPNLNPDLSEQYVLLRGGGRSCDKGWNAGKAAKFLVANGVPDESCWPYDTGDLDPAGCCEDLETRLVKAKSFRRLPYEEIKSSLVENGPVLARFDVHEDIDCYRGGVYRQVIINRRGGHVVTIVGYDDVQGCWIVKNSWGPEWGEGGWLRIGYNEVGIDSVVYEIRLF